MTNKKIILKVTEHEATKQRRVNIPKSEETLEKGDLVKLEKIKIK